jgi:hypothetical protein
MIRHYVLTLTGSAQRLSAVLPGLDGGPNDLPIRAISIQPGTANANPCYVGGYDSGSAVSSSSYGVRFEAAAAGVPPAPFVFGEFANLPMKLSDFAIIGTNTETVKVLIVT